MTTRTITAATVVMWLPIVPVGWHLGYQSVGAHILLLGFALALVLSSWNLVRYFFAPIGTSDAVIRLGVVAFALVVFIGLTLGSAGWIGRWPYAASLAVILTGCAFLNPSPAAMPTARWASVPLVAIAIMGALGALAVGFGLTHAPFNLYDSLSYHLFFAARWLQDHRLSIIPTPFSDPAQAYQPGNGELFLMWLMLPVHGDLVARVGQLPFAALGAVAVYGLARRLGAAMEHAVFPSVCFLMARPVFEQAIGANVDVICASMFATSLYLGIVAVDRDTREDWILWGISAGLALGTKFLALAYLPVLLLLPMAHGVRMKAVWALPGIAVLALPWYLRNWIVAGSPVYPATLSIAGRTLAEGAFTRAAMPNTIFHSSRLDLLPVVAGAAFGPALVVACGLFVVWGSLQLLRGGWWAGGFLIAMPCLMAVLFWWGLPVNTDPRFLMPAVAPALVPLAFVFSRGRRARAIFPWIAALAMLWILRGAAGSLPVPRDLPWFMDGFLQLRGLVAPPFIGLIGALVLATGTIWWFLARRVRAAPLVLALICAATAGVLAVGADRWCQPDRCDYLDVSDTFIKPGLPRAWRWMDAHVSQATVAYTGINLPYPLSGPQLTNRVIYVNIDGHPTWRLHDYDRAYRDGTFQPQRPVLAASSGELMPVSSGTGPRKDAIRPRYERLEGLQGRWVRNLATLRVGYLFVSVLSAYERDYQWRNAQGFPVEDAWARSNPQIFRLEYENDQVRIYSVSAGEVAR